MEESILNSFKKKMENSYSVFLDELLKLKTGRASPSLLESIIVDAYNSKMKISELSTVNVAETKLLTVQVWDNNLVSNVEKSINFHKKRLS